MNWENFKKCFLKNLKKILRMVHIATIIHMLQFDLFCSALCETHVHTVETSKQA